MAVTVQFGKRTATIDKLHWSSEDAALADTLNRLRDPLGPWAADPHPDLTAAQAAATLLAGKVVSYTKPAPLPEGAIR